MKKIYAINAVNQLIDNIALRNFARLILGYSERATTEVKESEPIEINYKGITISISWDYITIVNENTNEVVHTTSSAKEVKEFIYNYFKEI